MSNQVEKPQGAYYFDEEAQLWVTNGMHCKKHFEWWLQKHQVAVNEENEETLTAQYASSYLSNN